jgi:hypothetical protein
MNGMDVNGVAKAPVSSCEVSVVHAAFERPARLMRTAGTGSKTTPSLSLEFSNRSGKAIASVELVAEIKVKRSVYQLDSRTEDFAFRLTGVDGPQREWLSQAALGLTGLTIRKVSYADGSSWEPKNKHTCAYPFSPGTIQVAQ